MNRVTIRFDILHRGSVVAHARILPVADRIALFDAGFVCEISGTAATQIPAPELQAYRHRRACSHRWKVES